MVGRRDGRLPLLVGAVVAVIALGAVVALVLARGGSGMADQETPLRAARGATTTAAQAVAPVGTAAPGRDASGLVVVAASTLPAEAQRTLALIERGGPFPYDRDGVVFSNLERRLPAQRKGYYHEYTVPTPGSKTRGARRLVTGSAGEVYYTGDHYATFARVDVAR